MLLQHFTYSTSLEFPSLSPQMGNWHPVFYIVYQYSFRLREFYTAGMICRRDFMPPAYYAAGLLCRRCLRYRDAPDAALSD